MPVQMSSNMLMASPLVCRSFVASAARRLGITSVIIFGAWPLVSPAFTCMKRQACAQSCILTAGSERLLIYSFEFTFESNYVCHMQKRRAEKNEIKGGTFPLSCIVCLFASKVCRSILLWAQDGVHSFRIEAMLATPTSQSVF